MILIGKRDILAYYFEGLVFVLETGVEGEAQSSPARMFRPFTGTLLTG